MQVVPKTRPSLKQKMISLPLMVGTSIVVVVTLSFIVYFNLGNLSDVSAAVQNYQTAQEGDWTTASTWVDKMSPTTTALADNILINSGHGVYLNGPLDLKNGATITISKTGELTINGEVAVQNNLTLVNEGKLTINGNFTAKNGASVTVSGSGNMNVSGNMAFDNNANFSVDGRLDVGGDLTFGANSNFSGNGNVQIAGWGCSDWQGPGTCGEKKGILPVELMVFTVKELADGVEVYWQTATEENNDYFTLQWSTDGEHYEVITTVPGHGTTMEVKSYRYVHTEPAVGRAYYRLMQTDYDGRVQTFSPVAIDWEGGTAFENISFTLYPNPVQGNSIHVRFEEAVVGDLLLKNNGGALLMTRQILESEDDIELPLPNNLPPGVYYVIFKVKSKTYTERFIKK